MAAAHKLVAETAQKMAHVMYDNMMTADNAVYKEFKENFPDLPTSKLEELFVLQMWPRLLKQARATLAGMLGGDYPESLKEQIHEALVLDNDLKMGRKAQFVRSKNMAKN